MPESWYHQYVSPTDTQFGNGIRATVDHIVAVIASRAKKMDWALFVSRHCTESLSDCFRILKDASKTLQNEDPNFSKLPMEARLNDIWMTVATRYNLHAGMYRYYCSLLPLICLFFLTD